MKSFGVYIFPIIAALLAATGSIKQKHPDLNPNAIPEYFYKTPLEIDNSDKWVDSVFNKLSREERIAQLIMIAAYSNKDRAHTEKIIGQIKELGIGGIIFFQGGPGRQLNMTNEFQAVSKVPLMIAIDGEWGLSMRLDSTMKFPWNMTLGAIQNDTLIYKMAAEIAKQCRRIGTHFNFGPVVDVNNNPKNPIINARSFGEDPYKVARKGIAYMKGLQDFGVVATAKHFPGHGDTDKDSHKALPIIEHNRKRLDSIEILPFKALIENGVGSVMVAHLSIPALDKTPNLASSLSPKVVNGLLKQELGFTGLAFTDALNMKGVADFFSPGEAELRAILAGNDILLMPANPSKSIEVINKAIDDGKISEEEINLRCKKVLKTKYWLGLNKKQNLYQSPEYLQKDLFSQDADEVLRELTEASLTVIKNNKNLIPLKNLDTLKIAAVSIGDAGNPNHFHKTLNLYTQVSSFELSEDFTQADAEKLSRDLKDFNLVIVSLHKSNVNPFKSYKMNAATKTLVGRIATEKTVILNVFSNPYCLIDFSESQKALSIILSYQNSEYAQFYSAQLIFGGLSASGKLPVTINKNFPAGFGIDTEKPIRLKYTTPRGAGLKGSLDAIDKIVEEGIAQKAYPGAQVFAAVNGKVFINKSYGYHTYDNKRAVNNDDIYDLASVTKVTATLLAFMRLVDEGLVDLDEKIGKYIPELIGSNKYNLKIRDVLMHQAGLKTWIPFYKHTIIDKKLNPLLYSTEKKGDFVLPVADQIWGHKSLKDSIYKSIYFSALDTPGKYSYSDLGFYITQYMVENITNRELSELVWENFYKPLGATTTGFNPLSRFPKDRIVPTEADSLFRKQLIHGYVHDQGAAMMGGVAGHAGLFSNANDLAKLLQMYLQNGEYGGKRYLSDATLKEFTRCAACIKNRRGLGFDKPTQGGGKSPVCDCVSLASFGHLGFTGTVIWIDPSYNLIYIFLSNRVYPDAENKKLQSLNIRNRVQEEIYKLISKASI